MICYLDNSATTRPLDIVTDYMDKINREFFGNPSSLHTCGFEAEKIVKKARETILNALGDKDGNLVFTAGGTEANNLAIIGLMRNKLKRNPEAVTGITEHPSVSECFLYLKDNGAEVKVCPVKENGVINYDELRNLITQKTELVSLMLVNNEVGAKLDAGLVRKIIKEKNSKAIFHVDAVQGFGKVDINVKKMGIDMLSLSGHKINGPKGVGALYFRKGISLTPVIFGGHQEGNLRSGTHNVPAIGGLSLATENMMKNFKENTERMRENKEFIINELKKILFCQINGGNGEEYAPNIINASFEKIKSEIFLHALEREGVFVSSGSACSSNRPAPSHVLLAMGLDRKRVDTAIRISLSPENTREELEYAVEKINKVAKEIHSVM